MAGEDQPLIPSTWPNHPEQTLAQVIQFPHGPTITLGWEAGSQKFMELELFAIASEYLHVVVCQLHWGHERPAHPFHYFSCWVFWQLLSTPHWLFWLMFPSSSLPLLRSSCLWHFCLRIRAQTKKVMLWVSRDKYLFQMREVGHRMGEIVAEVMGKDTQAMYQDHLNVHTHSTQPWTYTCLSPFLLHTLIQTHMPYIMIIVQSFAMPLHHGLHKALSSCSLQLSIYRFSSKHSLVGTI